MVMTQRYHADTSVLSGVIGTVEVINRPQLCFCFMSYLWAMHHTYSELCIRGQIFTSSTLFALDPSHKAQRNGHRKQEVGKWLHIFECFATNRQSARAGEQSGAAQLQMDANRVSYNMVAFP